jgi:hypothetical protein
VLAEGLELDLANEDLTANEKLVRIRQYHADVEALNEEARKRDEDNENKKRDAYFSITQSSLDGLAALNKISSDKELTKLEKDKKSRLATLDTEYKAGRISKEQYEADKSSIETSYDAQTRAIKKDAAEKDKELQIAQSIISGTLAVIKTAAANAETGGIFSPVTIATGVAAALATAKIIATPIPEFEKGGIWGQAGRAMKRGVSQAWRGVKEYATGGRINPTAGVADVGQRHSGGGIRMVDGATGEHLGEWERGEAYMILSRDTYANNKHLIDELIDTSLHRGGAPVRRQQGYYEDGGTFGGSPAPSTQTSAKADSKELVQLLRENRDAIRALPSRQYIGWDQEDTAELEERLNERAEDRAASQVR